MRYIRDMLFMLVDYLIITLSSQIIKLQLFYPYSLFNLQRFDITTIAEQSY